jgi:prepilin-type processing-associated H-X9-DG protein
MYPPSRITDGLGTKGPGHGGAPGVNVASWKNLVQPYAKNIQLFWCPDSRANMALIYDPNALLPVPGWCGYSSMFDMVSFDCNPISLGYTANPYCVMANNTFFQKGYAVAGPFAGGLRVEGGIDPDPNLPLIGQASIPEVAETAWILDTKNVETFTYFDSMNRCWNDQGPGGGQGQWNPGITPTCCVDPSSPSGNRRPYGWWGIHSKGIQMCFADGHAKWERHQSYIANNHIKWDCFQRPEDAKTWPTGSFLNSNWSCTQGPVVNANPAECRARAAALVPREEL